jgi:hypothetical protein
MLHSDIFPEHSCEVSKFNWTELHYVQFAWCSLAARVHLCAGLGLGDSCAAGGAGRFSSLGRLLVFSVANYSQHPPSDRIPQ